MGKKNIAYINPQMLIWARSETPFISPEAVELSFPAINAADLTKWESGEEYPSINEAKKLASIYKVPFACFYLTTPPSKKPRRYTDRHTLRGQIPDEISYSLWSEIRRIQSIRDGIIEYADEEFLCRQIPIVSDDGVTAVANSIREYLGLTTPLKTQSAYGNNPFNYYKSIVERNGIMVAQISGVEISEMKGLSIYFDSVPIIAINNKDYDRSKVFSLFHELAHIFRRSSSLCTIDLEEHSDQEEVICDRIAAEALMPKDAFSKIAQGYIAGQTNYDSIIIGRIAGRFGVSTIAALRRLHETGLIGKTEFFDLYDIIADEYQANLANIEAARKGKNIPVHYYIKYLNQTGYIFPRVVILAHATGAISHGEMCRALGVNTKHISSIEQAVMYK